MVESTKRTSWSICVFLFQNLSKHMLQFVGTVVHFAVIYWHCYTSAKHLLALCQALLYIWQASALHFPGNPTSCVSHLKTRRSGEKCSFARRIPRMPPRHALFPDQTQNIRGLRGKISATESKKSALALDPIGSTKCGNCPKTTRLLCPRSSRCRLSKTSLPMHLWWRKISTSARGDWRLACRCSERVLKNTHTLQEALFVDSTADSTSVRDVDDIVDELLEVQSEPKEEWQWKTDGFWALIGIGVGVLLAWRLRSRDGDSPDQMFVHPAKPKKEVV